MKVSLFVELSVPKPWTPTTEAERVNEALAVVGEAVRHVEANGV